MLLPKWFLAIGLMVHAKKSLSSCQLARDVGLNTKTAWFMQQLIRSGMAANEASLLQGIVEVDETYVGGKAAVIGAVERGGKVVARVARDLTKGSCASSRRPSAPVRRCISAHTNTIEGF